MRRRVADVAQPTAGAALAEDLGCTARPVARRAPDTSVPPTLSRTPRPQRPSRPRPGRQRQRTARSDPSNTNRTTRIASSSHGRWCPPRHPCQMPAPPPPARAWGSWDRLPGAGCNAAAGTDVMPRRFRSTPHAAPTIRVRTRQPTVGQGERGVLQHPSAHGFRCRDPGSERTSTPQDEGRRPVDARPPPVRPRSLPLRCWRKPVAPDPVV